MIKAIGAHKVPLIQDPQPLSVPLVIIVPQALLLLLNALQELISQESSKKNVSIVLLDSTAKKVPPPIRVAQLVTTAQIKPSQPNNILAISVPTMTKLRGKMP